MLGMRLAWEIGLDSKLLAPLFYSLLLKDLGCSSNAARVCYLFGADDRSVKQDLKTTDWTQRSATAQYVFRNVAPAGPLREKIERIVRLAVSGQRQARELIQIRCDRGASIASELGLPAETCAAIRCLDEHWDGQGQPQGLSGTDIPILARIVNLAQTTDVFVMRDGVEAALDVMASRSGTWFDPDLVKALLSLRLEHHFWDQALSKDPRRFIHEFEPDDDLLTSDEATLDRVCNAFAQVIDAKSPWTAGTPSASPRSPWGCRPCSDSIRRGSRTSGAPRFCTTSASSESRTRSWTKAGKLTDAEFAEVKKHPAYTYEILRRVHCFEPFADLAASHHEKLDGSGYHRGLTGKQLSTDARVLAVADLYEALAAPPSLPSRAGRAPGASHPRG